MPRRNVRRSNTALKACSLDMPETYDVIFKGGIVVNQDGEIARDLGVSGGKIAVIGDLSRASAGETVDCRVRMDGDAGRRHGARQ